MSWDLLITDALVFDGISDEPRTEDVAIADGRIAARGETLDRTQAMRVIDGSGKWLMPGLLDIHTHYDLEVELDPRLPESVRHGTTTVVMSNCSLGLAFGAQRRDGADPIVDCFVRVENMPKHVLEKAADIAEGWDNSADYLRHLDELPLGPNIVPLVPHSMLRIEAMGLDASISRDPTEDELSEMERLLDEALRQGYAGFSTDALPFHYLANDPNRKTKIPTQFGTYKELKRLTNRVREHDAVWQATPPKDSPPEILRNFLLTSGRLHGKPLRITAVAALDVVTNRSLGFMGRVLTRLLNSFVVNGKFRLQALAAPFKVWSEGAVTPLAEEIPELRALNEPDLDDRAGRMAVMRDEAWRADFKKMWNDGKRGFGPTRLKRALRLEDHTLTRDLADMFVERCPGVEWEGLALSEVYRRYQAWRGGDDVSEADAKAFDALTERTIEDDGDFFLALLEHFDTDLYWWTYAANVDPDALAKLVMDPQLLPGFSDSGAHITNMAFYDANLRALQIAQRQGVETVAFTVGRLTREPADFFGLDVGSIEVGAQADITMINPSALAAYRSEEQIESRYRECFEHDQLVNRSPGVVPLVTIAGEVVWEDDQFGESLGQKKLGRALRNQRMEAEPTGPVVRDAAAE